MTLTDEVRLLRKENRELKEEICLKNNRINRMIEKYNKLNEKYKRLTEQNNTSVPPFFDELLNGFKG